MEPLLEGDPESWARVLRVNILGVLVCFQAAARVMVANGRGGRLLATASIAGLAQGEAEGAPYAATKAGVGGIVGHSPSSSRPTGSR